MLRISSDLIFERQFIGDTPRRVRIPLLSKAEALSLPEEHKAETNISLKKIEFDIQSKTHQAKAPAFWSRGDLIIVQ